MEKCQSLNLMEAAQELINWWSDEVHNESSMFAKTVYRMDMMDCFLMLRQLEAFNSQ